MSEQLTTEQQAEIIIHEIIQATKNRIINILEPQFNKISDGHYHFDKGLADAILTDIRNA
jgi:hypothetical protein